jgi:hypothetical protein
LQRTAFGPEKTEWQKAGDTCSMGSFTTNMLHERRDEKIRNAYKILVGKYEEKRSHGKPTYRLDDNTKMDLKK